MDKINVYYDEFENHIKSFKTKYGLDLLQVTVLQEECAELIQALFKCIRDKLHARKIVVEEITHVLISIRLVCEYYNIGMEDIIHEVRIKDDQL